MAGKQPFFDNFNAGMDARKRIVPFPSKGNPPFYLTENARPLPNAKIMQRGGFYGQMDVSGTGFYGCYAAIANLHTFATLADWQASATPYNLDTDAYGTKQLVVHPLICPDNTAATLADIAFCEHVNGSLYVVAKFSDTSVRTWYHYWLQGEQAPKWVATQSTSGGDVVNPTTGFNGYTYQAQTCAPGSKTGVAEPVWPTAIGSTVVDGDITWMCIAGDISDAPDSCAVRKLSHKIFAADGDTVPFSATDAPADWSSNGDAGFLPTGDLFEGDNQATALGVYKGDLVVFTAEGMQLWQTDPDPSSMSFITQAKGVGTIFPLAVVDREDDVYFVSSGGIRSVSVQGYSQSNAAEDIGSPIDPMVQDLLNSGSLTTTSVKVTHDPTMGAVIFSFGTGAQPTTAYALYLSRTTKMRAWGRITVPYNVQWVAQCRGLYLMDQSRGLVRYSETDTRHAGNPIADDYWNAGAWAASPYLARMVTPFLTMDGMQYSVKALSTAFEYANFYATVCPDSQSSFLTDAGNGATDVTLDPYTGLTMIVSPTASAAQNGYFDSLMHGRLYVEGRSAAQALAVVFGTTDAANIAKLTNVGLIVQGGGSLIPIAE